MEADTGRVAGAAVAAGLTVTYHGDKVGLRVEPGRSRAGEVVVADIGIPSALTLEPVAWLAGARAPPPCRPRRRPATSTAPARCSWSPGPRA